MLRAIVQILKVLTIAVTALLVATGGARVFALAVDRATPDDVGDPVEIAIAEGEDADAVADKLADAGLIRSKFLFTGQMRLNSLAPKEGTYALTKGMTVEQIMDSVSGAEQPEVAQAEDAAEEAAAEVGAGETVPVTIREGLRLEEIAEEAEKAGVEGGAEAFMKAIDEVDRSQYDFLAGVPENASLEGFLFPNTYDFVLDSAAFNVEQMLNQFGQQFDEELRARADTMGLGVRGVVTLASIVEREAAVPEERPTIAAVYLNRIEQGIRLDADPTVQYVNGKPGEWWPELQGPELEVEGPYNTYKVDGLPPGPIANPGFASIQAVLIPEPVDYIYFLAKQDGSGEHAFTNNYEEQKQNQCTYLEQCG